MTFVLMYHIMLLPLLLLLCLAFFGAAAGAEPSGAEDGQEG